MERVDSQGYSHCSHWQCSSCLICFYFLSSWYIFSFLVTFSSFKYVKGTKGTHVRIVFCFPLFIPISLCSSFSKSKSLHLCSVWRWSLAADRQIMRTAVRGILSGSWGDWGRHTGRPRTSGITELTLSLASSHRTGHPTVLVSACANMHGESWNWPFLAAFD